MSNRYKGGVISATPPTLVAGAGASGTWTLEQQMQANAAGLWPVNGPFFIEDCFSTYLYTGNGSTQTITNNIDLSTKGGLTWIKARTDTSGGATSHALVDTVRGSSKWLSSNATSSEATNANLVTGFTTSGFSVGTAPYWANENSIPYVSWTFRKQPKFFDIVTYTGTGAVQNIAHNLGSVPGCIIVKTTNATTNWIVQHRSSGGGTQRGLLNSTSAFGANSTMWNNTDPTSSVFTVGTNADTNQSGNTFVAYLFAHDAGGFGLTGTDNVISCGSFTSGNPSSTPVTVTLGYEPQWILVKPNNSANSWAIYDTMRGWSDSTGGDAYLLPNTSGAEGTGTYGYPTATGFIAFNGFNTSTECIYIAIRRGPMAVPTLGTSVFSPIAYTGNSTTNTTVQNLTTSFAGDAVIIQQRTSGNRPLAFDKLRGNTQGLYTSATTAEENIATARPGQSVGFNNTQTVLTGQFTANGNYNYSGDTFVGWNFKRAPSFFDEVCYTGNGTFANRTHNLTVAPELAITKRRSGVSQWVVIYPTSPPNGNYLTLETTDAANSWGSTGFTTTEFGVAEDTSAQTYVTYLFATCAGVSKVGSYTGNGTSQTINCGFTSGARFVLIKRTDASGDWYVYDTARGMTVLTDPYLQLNNTNAEVATLGSVTTVSTGFALNSAITAAINVSAGTYIFLAIA